MTRFLTVIMMLCLFVVGAFAQQTKNAPPSEKKEHVFKGKVEKVDPNAKTFTVNGENVEGWMGAMTMVYVPDKEEVLKQVKVGDQITAKVYDGDFRTLHDVHVVPAAKPARNKREEVRIAGAINVTVLGTHPQYLILGLQDLGTEGSVPKAAPTGLWEQRRVAPRQSPDQLVQRFPGCREHKRGPIPIQFKARRLR